jgi:hypothetical protein
MKKFNIEQSITTMQGWLAPASATTLSWLAVILFHSATLPTLIAVLTGLSDKMPSVDMVLLTWAGLTAMFAQAVVQRNFLNIVTITLGFIIQSSLMVLIFFK